jgi:hypothetical protein
VVGEMYRVLVSNPYDGGRSVPRAVTKGINDPAQRRALQRAIRGLHGWNSLSACRPGRAPRATWKSLDDAVDAIETATGYDLGALDNSSVYLSDSWCKFVEKRAKNCPTNDPEVRDRKSGRLKYSSAWRKALRQTIGRKGNRSWLKIDAGVLERLNEALALETGDPDAEFRMPETIVAVFAWFDAVERCADEHDRQVRDLVADAHAGRLPLIVLQSVPF